MTDRLGSRGLPIPTHHFNSWVPIEVAHSAHWDGWEQPRTGVDRGSGGRPNPDPHRALQFLSNFLSDEADVAKLNDAFRICIGIVYKPANGCIGVEYGACAAQAPPPPPHQNRL